MKIVASCVSVFFLVVAIVVPVDAKDITRLISEQTDYNEQLQRACLSYCQGNRRKGTLKRVFLERISENSLAVRVKANLRNLHFQRLVIGGGFNLFDYTVKIEAFGTLDERTCKLRIDRIHILHDRLGLASLAKQQAGRIHKIKDCRKFTSGL